MDPWQLVVRGAVLGLACGDALGHAAASGQVGRADAPDALAASRLPARLGWTATTALALRTVEHRRVVGVIRPDRLALDLADTHRQDARRWLDPDAAQALSFAGAGRPDHRVDSRDGSDCAARAALLGLTAPHRSTGEIAADARLAAMATHKDLTVHACAALAARTTARVAGAHPTSPADPAEIVAACGEHLPAAECRAVAHGAVRLAARSASPTAALRVLRDISPSALGVGLALTAFLTHPRDIAAAIRFAVTAGHAPRAVAGLAGCLVGAYTDESVLPTVWCLRLEHVGAIWEQASSLGRPPTVADRPLAQALPTR